NLVGRAYVDVEAAKDVQLVGSYCKTTRQDCACGIARPVVSSSETRYRIGNRIVEEHACRSSRLPSCGPAHAIDIWRPTDGEHAASHVVHLVVRIRGRFDSPCVVA